MAYRERIPLMELEYDVDGSYGHTKWSIDEHELTKFAKFGMEVNMDDGIALMANPDRDNVAIACYRLEPGLVLRTRHGAKVTIGRTILEGHRFAIKVIERGEFLLSWGEPFGKATTTTIQPGDYVCNRKMCHTLNTREGIPDDLVNLVPNFEDYLKPFSFNYTDDCDQQNVTTITMDRQNHTFDGYQRFGSRGVGTRNFIVVIGTSNRIGPVVEKVEEYFQTQSMHGLDGVVGVSHTETGVGNNVELLRRTLAGFVIHPNVAGALVVSYSDEPFTADTLQEYMLGQSFYKQGLHSTPHEFLCLEETSFQEQVNEVISALEDALIPTACSPHNCTRTKVPLSKLTVALQCGGSDAFSGITGNPLVGEVSRQVVLEGGTALLAETDELIGAESYILRKVKNKDVANQFLGMIQQIKTLLGYHGVSAEGNPSGGNLYRGLYNIAIKSLGAATKKHPQIQLDGVVDYSEWLGQTCKGYYFMNSPGNDLESIAGQVATGCNVIFFTTGNGSITNFPFVPTVKIVTTSKRYQLLSKDMDFDAGRLQHMPMETLSRLLLQETIQVASGKLTKGEHAKHSQVSIWRDWRQTTPDMLDTFLQSDDLIDREGTDDKTTSSKLLKIAASTVPLELPSFPTYRRRLVLVMPTSLCSSKVAVRIANELAPDFANVFDFVALPHTEGCGSNYGPVGKHGMEMFDRLIMGHVAHPMVEYALLLEHGCEMNHNDKMRAQITLHQKRKNDISLPRVGFASVQLDGGIESVTAKCKSLVAMHHRAQPSREECKATEQHEKENEKQISGIGIFLERNQSGAIVEVFASFIHAVHHKCKIVVVMQGCSDHGSIDFGESIVGKPVAVYDMACPSEDPLEIITGLASTGVEVILSAFERPLVGHPFVPVLQVGLDSKRQDFDLILPSNGTVSSNLDQLVRKLLESNLRCKANLQKRVGFQISRGHFGVSV